MEDSSWVFVDKPEKHEKDEEIKVYSTKCESDEIIRKKLQEKEINHKVIYIEAKHIPRQTDIMSNSGYDSDLDSDYMSDIAGSWEDGGSWEKYDLSGMPVIPFDRWKKKTDLKKLNKFVIIQKKRKKMILDLLSTNPEFQIYKERYINPKMFFEPVRYRTLVQIVKDRKNDEIATEFFETLDEYTLNIIDKMIRNRLVKNVNQIVNIKGKNSIILHTDLNQNCRNESTGFILKIFKRTFINYKGFHYISEFVSVTSWEAPTVTKHPRRIPNVLAARENSILGKLRSFGILCPEVVKLPQRLNRHITVMSFLGENGIPAPKIKDINLDHKSKLIAFEEIKQAMRIMYQEANIIHPDLLEHTLWHKDHCYFIDFSHSIDADHVNASYILTKNCEKIIEHFFKKMYARGLDIVPLVSYITDGR